MSETLIEHDDDHFLSYEAKRDGNAVSVYVASIERLGLDGARSYRDLRDHGAETDDFAAWAEAFLEINIRWDGQADVVQPCHGVRFVGAWEAEKYARALTHSYDLAKRVFGAEWAG